VFGFYFRVVVTIRAHALWLSCFGIRSPNQALLLVCSTFALAFTHVTSCSLQIPTPLPTSHITCTLSCTHAHYRHTPSHAPLTVLFSSRALHLSISLRAPPVYLSYLLFLVLCVVAVPFRVKRICLRHSGLGAVRPDILPHQQCC